MEIKVPEPVGVLDFEAALFTCAKVFVHLDTATQLAQSKRLEAWSKLLSSNLRGPGLDRDAGR